MLETNQRPQRDLRTLIELIGQRRVERELNVHRTTIGRWLAGHVRVPGATHQAVRSLLGDLPGTAGRWTGWRFHDGNLLSPAGESFRAGDVLSLILLRQQLSAQAREIVALKARLLIAEQAQPQAANEARRRA